MTGGVSPFSSLEARRARLEASDSERERERKVTTLVEIQQRSRALSVVSRGLHVSMSGHKGAIICRPSNKNPEKSSDTQGQVNV